MRQRVHVLGNVVEARDHRGFNAVTRFSMSLLFTKSVDPRLFDWESGCGS